MSVCQCSRDQCYQGVNHVMMHGLTRAHVLLTVPVQSSSSSSSVEFLRPCPSVSPVIQLPCEKHLGETKFRSVNQVEVPSVFFDEHLRSVTQDLGGLQESSLHPLSVATASFPSVRPHSILSSHSHPSSASPMSLSHQGTNNWVKLSN